jgi:hypothetical protein
MLQTSPFEIIARRDFSVQHLTVDHHDLAAFGFNERRIVGAFTARGMGAPQHLGAKRLWCLHCTQ